MGFVPSQNYRIGMTFSLCGSTIGYIVYSFVIVVILDKRGANIIIGRKLAHQKHNEFSLRDLKGIFWFCIMPFAICFVVSSTPLQPMARCFLLASLDLIQANPILLMSSYSSLANNHHTFSRFALGYVGYNILWAVFGIFLGMGTQALYMLSVTV